MTVTYIYTLLCFPGGTSGKEPTASAANVRDVDLIPGLGRSPEGDYGNPLQYSFLENPMDRGACQAAVQWVTKSRTQLKQSSTAQHGTHCLFMGQALF